MAIMTITSRHARAMAYKAQLDEAGVWIALGRTITPWDDENHPPPPDPHAVDIEEITGFQAVENISFVRRNENGSIFYLGDYYELISDLEATNTLCTLLYVRAVIRPIQMGSTYRQIGVYRGLISVDNLNPDFPKPPYDFLTLDQVLSHGALDIYDNFPPTTRLPNQRDEYAFMLQF